VSPSKAEHYLTLFNWPRKGASSTSAWADIRPYILAIASGGKFKFMKDENTMLASCSDLFRPVWFKIERYDD